MGFGWECGRVGAIAWRADIHYLSSCPPIPFLKEERETMKWIQVHCILMFYFSYSNQVNVIFCFTLGPGHQMVTYSLVACMVCAKFCVNHCIRMWFTWNTWKYHNIHLRQNESKICTAAWKPLSKPILCSSNHVVSVVWDVLLNYFETKSRWFATVDARISIQNSKNKVFGFVFI